MKDMYSEQLC